MSPKKTYYENLAGPKNVIIIAGMNKIVTDEATGVERVPGESKSSWWVRN